MQPAAWTLLALLACGHALADFVVQTERTVVRKRTSGRALALHGLEVAVVHGAVVLPFFPSRIGLAVVAALAVLHAGIDAAKDAAAARRPRPLAWFLADQALHLAAVAGAWIAWGAAFDGRPPSPLAPAALADVGRIALAVGLWAFNWNGASALVAGLLRRLDPPDAESEEAEPDGPRVGRLIGILERTLVLVFAAAGQWSAIGLVFAAKSIARFRELEDRPFAEKYLVGTLTSFLVGVASGVVVSRLLPLAFGS